MAEYKARTLQSSFSTMECTTTTTALNEHHVLVDFLDGMDEFDLQPKKTTASAKEHKRKRSSKAKVQGAKKSVLPWNKRKEEIKRLRGEVQVMESQLAFLRLQDLHAKMYDQCAPEGQKQQKAAALRERQRRQEAQLENSQLKSKIKNCVTICEVMKSTLQVADIGRAEQTTRESSFAERSLQADLKATQWLSVLNTAIFNILEHRVNARIREWGSVLHETQFSTTMTDADTDQVLVYREHGRSESTIELKRTRLIPFSAEQTSRIAWDVVQSGPFPNEQSVRVCGYLDDTMASEGSCSHPLKCGGSVILRVYCVVKRVGIPGGCAVIVESISEWLAYPAASAPWTCVTQDSGHAVVRPHEMQDVSTRLCRTQTIARLRTAGADEVAAIRHPNQSRSQLTSDVGDVVIPSFREIMSSRHQLLDNALLDSSRTKTLVK